MQYRAIILHFPCIAMCRADSHHSLSTACSLANIAPRKLALTQPLLQGPAMSVFLHEGDLPDGVLQGSGPLAVDTETMGLNTHRDRLCLVQISDGGGDEHLVRFGQDSDFAAPNLRRILADVERLKLYHFARFDLAAIEHYLGVTAAPVFCTKIASRLTRTFTDRHGLKELVKDERLGSAVAERRAKGICGKRCTLPAPAERRIRGAAGTRRARRNCAGLFRFPAGSRPARSGWLARGGYFCA
jgi:3'-5' exonuclease